MKKLLTIILIFFIQNGFAQTDTFACTLLRSIVIDSKDNMFVSVDMKKIYKFTPDGKGELFYEQKDESKKSFVIKQIAIDSKDNIYFMPYNNSIAKISPEGKFINNYLNLNLKVRASKDGLEKTASINDARKITIDDKDNLYILDVQYANGSSRGNGDFFVDADSCIIRKISPDLMVTTLRDKDGKPVILKYPSSFITTDRDGNVLFNLQGSINKINNDGKISAILGGGKVEKHFAKSGGPYQVYVIGDTSKADISDIQSMYVAKNNDIYFMDMEVHRVLKLSKGIVKEVAGSGDTKMFTSHTAAGIAGGCKDGKGPNSKVGFISSFKEDSKGNIFMTDLGCSSLRKLSLDGTVSTIYKFKRISKYSNR
jgi:hypothetical protein